MTKKNARWFFQSVQALVRELLGPYVDRGNRHPVEKSMCAKVRLAKKIGTLKYCRYISTWQEKPVLEN